MFLSEFDVPLLGDAEQLTSDIAQHASFNVKYLTERGVDKVVEKQIDLYLNCNTGQFHDRRTESLMIDMIHMLNVYRNPPSQPVTTTTQNNVSLLDEPVLWTNKEDNNNNTPDIPLQTSYFFVPAWSMLSTLAIRVLVETEFMLNRRHRRFDWTTFVWEKIRILRKVQTKHSFVYTLLIKVFD